MVYIATYNAASFFLIKGRVSKPFNSLLGETYELVTSNFRFFSEVVSQNPPLAAINCEGEGWELTKTMCNTMTFNGK